MQYGVVLFLSAGLASGAGTDGRFIEVRAGARDGIERREVAEAAEGFSVSTSFGRLEARIRRAPDAITLVAWLDGNSERLVASYTLNPAPRIRVDLGAAGGIRFTATSDPGVRTPASGACEPLAEHTLLRALAEAGRARLAVPPTKERPDRATDAAGTLILATSAIATRLLRGCEVVPHGGCWSISPSRAACDGCCNDEAAIQTLLATMLCPALGPIGGAICAGTVYLQRRDCVRKCGEAFPDPLPSEGDVCGVGPNYGICLSVCFPGQRQEWDFPCHGTNLKCCVPDR